METEAAIVIPQPIYSIGQTVYTPTTERSVEALPCPDCMGSQKWSVTSPAGETYTTACPRCCQTYAFRDDMPSLKIEHYVAGTRAHLLTGYEINSRPTSWQPAVKYSASLGGGSSNTFSEPDIYATEAEALAAAEVKAAELNQEIAEKPQVLEARHFSSLTMDQARTSEMKNGVWESTYHAGCLLGRVREALSGENDDEERSQDEIMESLREAARWDFGYHVDHMPLRNLIVAATASDDPAVAEAVRSLPEPMIELFVVPVGGAPC